MNAGMREYSYLATDGGPHLVASAAWATRWRGLSLLGTGGLVLAGLLNAKLGEAGFRLGTFLMGDYGRACRVRSNAEVLRVRDGRVLVLKNPSMSACGRPLGMNPEQGFDVYSLHDWRDSDLDALVGRAAAWASASAEGLREICGAWAVDDGGVVLMGATDDAENAAYCVERLAAEPGRYRLRMGEYCADGEAVTVIRATLEA